ARELLLPDLGSSLAGEHVAAVDVHRALEQVCPADLLDEKMLLCRQLPYRGVNAEAVKGCLNLLQPEPSVPCTQRGPLVPETEAHLRQADRLYQFRGVRRGLQETRVALLDALCGANPDYAAWTTLEAITREEHGGRADSLLASWLGQKLASLPAERRVQAAG